MQKYVKPNYLYARFELFKSCVVNDFYYRRDDVTADFNKMYNI